MQRRADIKIRDYKIMIRCYGEDIIILQRKEEESNVKREVMIDIRNIH